ncbi:MAG: hypothetical protein ABI947_23435 [Chloroflexota bacterium]
MRSTILPFSMIAPSNAVFERDLRRVRWLRRPRALVMYSAYLLIGIPLIEAVLFALDYFRKMAALQLDRYYSTDFDLWFVLILLATFLISAAADLYYLVVTVNSINRLIESGEWDSLRLTPIPERDLVLGKVAVAQVRGWRLMTLDMALRLCGIVVIVALAVSTTNILQVRHELSTLLDAGIILVFCAAYVLEPLWRMRTIVAVGIALSAGIRNLAFAVLAGLAAVFALHIVQFFVIGFTISSLYAITFAFAIAADRRFETHLFTSLAGLLLTGAFAFALNYYYRQVQEAALRRAFRWAFKTD